MAEIIDFNRFRKDKARADRAEKAAENRAAHGRTKAEKDIEKAHAEKAAKLLDQHRRDGDEPDGAA